MSDKEKLLKILDYCDENIEQILFEYLATYYKDFSALRIYNFISDLNEKLYHKIADLENIKSISKERAFYLKTYLSGEMWKDEESAKRNLQPQINNAQVIIDACGI